MSDGIQKALYTAGGEYILNGKDYIGYYHVHPDLGAMVGKVHTPKIPHERLIGIDENPILSGYRSAYVDGEALETAQTTKLPFTYIPRPSTEDYKNGYITRYFIAKRNDWNQIFETSEKEFPKKLAGLSDGLWEDLELDWHITDNLEQESSIQYNISTEFKNDQIVKEASKIIPTVENYLKDLTQFST